MEHMSADMTRIALIGLGATALMDAWLLLLQRLNVPTLDFALLGRWLGHLRRGRWRHPAIAKAAPVRGESALGWLLHYATGIAFAGVLVAFAGSSWTHHPTLLPALAVGLATVAAPLLVLQPAMGAGIASSNTPRPLRSCLRSVMNHAVFGAGLYVSAEVVERILR
jgi:hypothetical protein